MMKVWIATTDGFYSAVQDADPRVMQVRTRAKVDAIKLADWLVRVGHVELSEEYPTVESMVLEWPGRDYPFRVLVWREHWASYVFAAASDISYSNFKNEVSKKQGWKRAATYHDVWSALLAISREHLRQPKKYEPLPRYRSSWWDDMLTPGPQDRHPIVPAAESDERHARCDKFKDQCKCDEELDAAIEEAGITGDWSKVTMLQLELGEDAI